jgi:hypothetical protein
MTSTPPLGYSLTPPHANLKEIFADTRMADKAVTLVKSAIQGYVDSFLNPAGRNRKFLTASMSPVGLQFVTDLTYDEQMKVSPNLRKTYLARFFAENIGRLPSVLLIDTGIEIQEAGINEITGAKRNIDGSWECQLTSLLKVSLSITTATLSEEDTSTLATLITMMFNPLASVTNNCILRDEGASWEVRLPLAGLSLGQASSVNIEGDTKTTVWTRSLDLACDFEGQIGLKMPTPDYDWIPPTIGQDDRPIPVFRNLMPNQDIHLGSVYPLLIEGMLTEYYLGVADPSVALVSSEPPYTIQPRKQGRTLLIVRDRGAPDVGGQIEPARGYITDIAFGVVP